MAASPPAPVITFNGVTKTYRNGVTALADARFAIPKGARAGLLGPNGAGKSTAVRLLQGALHPTAGWVTLLGAGAGTPEYMEARRRVGIVPQAAGPYRDLSAGEYLDLAHSLFGRGDAAATARRFGLTEHLGKNMADLSGGLQRRLLLAAALLADPEVLVLDEPSLGLDPVAAADMRRLLGELGDGRTLLICTNNLDEAQAVCDQVVILDHGRIVLQETMDQVRRGEPRLALRAIQGSAAVESFCAGRGLTVAREGDDVLVGLPDGEAAIPGLLRAALDAGLEVTECRQVHRDLAAVFFEVVGRG